LLATSVVTGEVVQKCLKQERLGTKERRKVKARKGNTSKREQSNHEGSKTRGKNKWAQRTPGQISWTEAFV